MYDKIGIISAEFYFKVSGTQLLIVKNDLINK